MPFPHSHLVVPGPRACRRGLGGLLGSWPTMTGSSQESEAGLGPWEPGCTRLPSNQNQMCDLVKGSRKVIATCPSGAWPRRLFLAPWRPPCHWQGGSRRQCRPGCLNKGQPAVGVPAVAKGAPLRSGWEGPPSLACAPGAQCLPHLSLSLLRARFPPSARNRAASEDGGPVTA